MDEAVDGDHALAAVCDRVDGESRAVAHVAAHEDIGLGGLPGHGVGLRGAVAVELDLGALQQLAPFCALTDGHQHVGAGDGDRLVLVIDGGEAMLGVIDAGTLFEYNPGHSPVFGQDLLRTPAVADDDSFLLDLRNLILCRGHFVPLLQTEHRNGPVRRTDGGPGYVSGHVAAADHDHVALQPDGIVLIDAAQEADAGLDAGGVLAGHAGQTPALQTDGDV